MKVIVPATTANLGPGFDLLGATLDIENEIVAEFADDYSLVEEGYSDKNPFSEHLIAQIMLGFFKEQGIVQPFSLQTKNRIPFARGLGSSSAAIVGALFLANEMCGRPLTKEELLNKAIAIEGHPDNVAPALLGGVVVCLKDSFINLPPPTVEACVLIPDFRLETKKAREALPSKINHGSAVKNSASLAQLILALERGDSDLFLSSLEDELHEPYRGKLIPGFFELRRQAEDFGGKLVISGSGPTLLYFANHHALVTAQELSEKWQLPNQVLPVKIGKTATRLGD